MSDPSDITGPTIAPAPERTHSPRSFGGFLAMSVEHSHVGVDYGAPDPVALIEGCTRRDPCEARSQLDLAITPEGTCSVLIRDGTWMLLDEGYTVVAAISHCPWCGWVLA